MKEAGMSFTRAARRLQYVPASPQAVGAGVGYLTAVGTLGGSRMCWSKTRPASIMPFSCLHTSKLACVEMGGGSQEPVELLCSRKGGRDGF